MWCGIFFFPQVVELSNKGRDTLFHLPAPAALG